MGGEFHGGNEAEFRFTTHISLNEMTLLLPVIDEKLVGLTNPPWTILTNFRQTQQICIYNINLIHTLY